MAVVEQAGGKQVVGRRLVAGAIDAGLVFLAFVFAVLLFTEEVPPEMCPFLEGASELGGEQVICEEFLGSARLATVGDVWTIILLLGAGLLAVFVGVRGQTGVTPGSHLLGLRCVNASGRPIGWGAAMGRGAMATVEWAFCFPLGLVVLGGRMIVSEDGRRFADKVSDSWIVDAEALRMAASAGGAGAPPAPGAIPVVPAPPPASPVAVAPSVAAPPPSPPSMVPPSVAPPPPSPPSIVPPSVAPPPLSATPKAVSAGGPATPSSAPDGEVAEGTDAAEVPESERPWWADN